MIYTHIGYRPDANLGRAWNDFMALIPDDAWAVLQDHDCVATTGRWYHQFAEAIAFRPEAGAFIVTTNRIAAPWQRAAEADPDNNDMAYHRAIGKARLARRTLLDVSRTKGWGAVAFAVSKLAWREVGGFADGLGCVDHSLHFGLQRVGRPVYLIEGCYFYHWRHWREQDPTSVHPKAANCQCRGPETPPTERIALP